MRKKALLIISITLIALSALLPGARSISADGYDYYYAYGWLTRASGEPAKKPGVYGHNYVYDNDVYTGFVAEFLQEELFRD